MSKEWRQFTRYPKRFRHVVAKMLDSNGVEITVSFLSNNMDWAASSICDLYGCRWGIETFFHCHPIEARYRASMGWQ